MSSNDRPPTTFTLDLRRPPALTRSPVGPARARAPAPVHDLITVCIDGCALLAETGCEFAVTGFGLPWPVDVRYDLAVVLEQLPEVLRDLRAGRATTLDFYGQGIERTIDISPRDDTVQLRCRLATETMPIAELERMLVHLAATFAHAVETMSPTFARSPPLPAWRQADVSERRP